MGPGVAYGFSTLYYGMLRFVKDVLPYGEMVGLENLA